MAAAAVAWTSCGRLARALAPQARRAPVRGPCAVRVTAVYDLRPGETPEQASQRRLRESERVEERVSYVSSMAEFRERLDKAAGKLVVLEAQSEQVCQTGWKEEPELHWKDDRKKALEPCLRMKHVFQRTARDCPDVTFLALDADSEEGQEICDELGIEVLPTLQAPQFYQGGQKVWEHRGVSQMDQDLGEAVLYYGDTAAAGVRASAYVRDLHSREDLEAFVSGQPERVLTVVDVSLTSAAPCVHIFPAVLALAKNMGPDYAAFARLMGDESAETQALLRELNILEARGGGGGVPTFLFYRNGQPVGRHVGSSRGDLIGQILAQQAAMGIAPPPPAGGSPRRAVRRRARAGSR
eukprot:scaffold8.g1357.t1